MEVERDTRRPKEKQTFRSAAEHYLLNGLPDGWELEAVPRRSRRAGTKHWDHYWIPPPEPGGIRNKRLRSMNEVRRFLNPENAAHERAKRDDQDNQAIRKVLDALLSKVEKRCGEKKAAAVAPGGHRRALPMRSVNDIMRDPLSAFMLFGIEQHASSPPAATAEARDFVKAYGQTWLGLTAAERLPYERMASALEPQRCALLRARAEKKRIGLANKARATPTQARTGPDELLDGAANAQLGSGHFAPGASSRGGAARGRGRGGAGGGSGRGKRPAQEEESDGGGGSKRMTPANAYAPQYLGGAVRRASKGGAADESDPPDSPKLE